MTDVPATGAPAAADRLPRLRVRPTRAAEVHLRSGHPWLFDRSLASVNRAGIDGEVAAIYDSRDQLLGLGIWDARSPMRVRVFHRGPAVALDREYWCRRLREALARRRQALGPFLLPGRPIQGMPEPSGKGRSANPVPSDGNLVDWTNACRVVHGESDGCPGLVVDLYGRTAVAKIYAMAWVNGLSGPADTVGRGPDGWNLPEVLAGELPVDQIVLRCSRNLKPALIGRGLQDGWTWHRSEHPAGGSESPLMAAAVLGPSMGPGEGGWVGMDGSRLPEGEGRVLFLENGVRFEADVLRGQKTGFFLDQRDNRARVGAMAAGARVLNTFSFSGGFSVHAACGGARRVVDVDISAHALDAAARNMALNAARMSGVVHERVQADTFQWLAEPGSRDFDIVILDPPSMARRQADREAAGHAYERLTALGWNRVAPGGCLVAASCSAHIPAAEFFERVSRILDRSGRSYQELARTQHPADHPIGFPEGAYLKAMFVRAMDSHPVRPGKRRR